MLSDCVKFYKSFFQFSSVLFSIIWNLSYFHLIKTCVFLYKYYSKLSKVNLNVFDISSEPILNLFSSSASKIASYTFFCFYQISVKTTVCTLPCGVCQFFASMKTFLVAIHGSFILGENDMVINYVIWTFLNGWFLPIFNLLPIRYVADIFYMCFENLKNNYAWNMNVIYLQLR